MDDVILIVHISFKRVAGVSRPWIVTLTQPLDSFNTIKIGLSAQELEFTYEDIMHNMSDKVKDFDDLHDVHEKIHPLENFEHELEKIVSLKLKKDRNKIIAVDQQTFDYLSSVLLKKNQVEVIQWEHSNKSNETVAVSLIMDRMMKSMERVDKVLYVVHVSFICVRGSLRPWIVTITTRDVIPKTFRIGLSLEKLEFTAEDVLYNLDDSNFPKMKEPLTYEIHPNEDFESALRAIYMQHFWMDGWIDHMMAVDQTSYEYLINVFKVDEIGLRLWTVPAKGLNWTLPVACKWRWENDENNCEGENGYTNINYN